MRVARIDDAFQLRRGEEAVGDEGLRQDGTIGRHGWWHRGHGSGLDERSRMLCRTVDPDRLQVVSLVNRVLQRAVRFAPGFRQVVERGRFDIIKGMFGPFLGEGAGFLAGSVAQSVRVGADRTGRDRQGRTGRAGRGLRRSGQ